MSCNENMYISPEGEEGIRTFKYKGGSDSILYAILWSPLAQFIVDRVLPNWLAPNLITFTGFVVVCFSATMIQIYSWDYQTNLPSWTMYLGAFSILFYQIFDNVDGKQARKTQSSSPLGMLFDHGCDTTTTWVIGLMICNTLQLGNSLLMFFCLLAMAYIGFFFAMWAQYHIGCMRLARINAIDEGLVLVESLFLFSAIFGQEIWHITFPMLYDLELRQVVIIGSAGVAVLQSLDFLRQVLIEKPLITTLASLGMPALITLVFTVTAFYSPTKAVDNYAYMYIYTYGFLWSKMVGHVQLAHITNEVLLNKKKPFIKKVDQWKLSWMLCCLAQILNIMSSYFLGGQCLINELELIQVLCIVAFVVYAHFCVCVSLHISRVLNIGIFTIRKPQQQKKTTYEELPQQQAKSAQELEIEFKVITQ